MNIGFLRKSGPGTVGADRALQSAADMLTQGHSVSLFPMQEAVRFCHPGNQFFRRKYRFPVLPDTVSTP